MDKLLNLLSQLIPLISFYPKWAQAIFLISFAAILLSFFVFVALYGPATENRKKARNESNAVATLSSEAKAYIKVMKSSQDPKELQSAVDFFKANPTEAALQSLATLAAREDSKFVFVQSDAIEAIGAIKTDKSLKLLLERAVSETTPGIKADYVRALQGFKDPSMIEPLISILETAGGDVVGYPSLVLARKLDDPKLTKAVKRHFDDVSRGPIHQEYFVLCRDVIVQLQTKVLHDSVGLQLNLPQSLELLLSRKTLNDFLHEKDPKNIVVYLTYLRRNQILPQSELAELVSAMLSSADVLVRWSVAELAANIVEDDLVGMALRKTFQSERVPFIDALLVEAFSRNWSDGDCQLVGSKFREYSIVRQYGLSTYVDSAETMVRHLIRHNCENAVLDVKLFSKTLSESDYMERGAESMARAVRALEKK